MRKSYVMFLLSLLTGCSPFIHDSNYHLTGKNLKTPYGMGDVDLHIIGHTTWGKCNTGTTHFIPSK